MARRVVLAMSGGVDSSVAAHLLKRDGYDVIGLFMRTGAHVDQPERRAKTCCSATDAIDAQKVADRLDIPFFALDFERDFGRIMDDFADEYLAGRTPNPCVLCNVWLKFGKLWAYGKQVGADFVATGHHARIGADGGEYPRIRRAVDPGKDQSYVLSGLRRELLPHVLLPVGGSTKAEIREMARELALPVHDKQDSQEICFIPDDDYLGFVRRRRPGSSEPGAIVDEQGSKVGEHGGIEAFTIGQRKGLGIAFGEPRYVVGIEPTTRTVTVGSRESLERPGLEASRFNWQIPRPAGPIPCLAQIRARHRAVSAVVEPAEGDRAVVRFEEPQPAVTPGQIVAVYEGEALLGGGWIDRAIGPDVA
ncbi:tRNA 2-thiouridine(34) synthase MnmA [Tautonia plasticadhaerens]|uniref:tRNA-specific 2-thiouridylase MnmA n=1 Tax=Tautonia plasticadhaerens TaxID=2527974 RepID=A0A518GYW4_9BACT|nr:tRNA 2-thiouridine(34) synthase MnmA [Tautonia plasticadhaerens]QDV33810.1 tRNA-specific 2-thiouridylase MnmA [Tautonia plasticadhaerens]